MLNKIKNIRKDSGFTIVELLIVIVVIGILAAITIVSYTGITQKANTTKAQTNAVAVQKVAEAFNADNGSYPNDVADFTSTEATTAKLPAGITVVLTTTDLTNAAAADKANTVAYVPSANGATIYYWDFAATPAGISATTIKVGN